LRLKPSRLFDIETAEPVRRRCDVAGDGSPRRRRIDHVDFIRGKIMTTVEAPIAEHHHDEGITSLLHRIRSEFLEMPGLRLTPAQAARLWGMERHMSERILDGLTLAGFLSKNKGAYLRASGA
jgi:hypothetical protein